jgi:hypothetical protein
MIHQVHLWLGADGTEDQGAGFGFEDRERRPVPIPVLVSDFFRHHDLALLAHVNYGHSRKLPPERPYSNPFLQQFRNVGLTPGVFAERPVFSLWPSAIALKGGWPPP